MKDFLIVGHGLAGAVLSQLLLEKGHSLQVMDQPQDNHSSSVAAGLYNPVTGRNMVKTWKASELFSVIEPLYSELEEKLDASFLRPIGIYRPFVSIAEQNDWDVKQSDAQHKNLISSVSKVPYQDYPLTDPHGGIHLSPAGYLKIPVFLDASKAKLLESESYNESAFDEGKLVIEDGQVKYAGLAYRNIIFCNGIRAKESALFGWLPFQAVKGEVLEAKSDQKIDTILNRGVFILPTDKGNLRIGSNYQNHFDDLLPSEKGRNEILEKLAKLSPKEVEITDSVAGVRPATKDRRPIIGKHPEYGHIYMFNGFGSKGVSLVPFFAQRFVEYLSEPQDQLGDTNIDRFYSSYH